MFIKLINDWLLLILTLFQLWIPSLIILNMVRKRWHIEEQMLLPVTAIFAGGIGYITFWIYFINHRAGNIVSLCILLFAIWGAVKRKNELKNLFLSKAVKIPFLLLVAVFLIYNGVLQYEKPGKDGTDAAANSIWKLPVDNILQYHFADSLYKGRDPRGPETDWLTSDRPPLQAGIFLTLHPLYRVFGPIQAYHFVSSLVQCFWVLAVYSLFAALGLAITTRLWGILLMACSGFHWINTVFTWPKMLSASYFLFGCLLWLTGKKNRYQFALGAIAFALSFLSHGGAAFAFLGAFLGFGFFSNIRKKISPKHLALASFVFVITAAPWFLYQKLYDPPGNRLLKMHLAGIDAIDSRGVIAALRDAYKPLTISNVGSRVLINIENMLPWKLNIAELSIANLGNYIRAGDFFNLSIELNILLVGILLCILKILGIPIGPRKNYGLSKQLLVMCAAGLMIWCILIFSPRGTVLHHSSYVFPLVLGTLAITALSEIGMWAIYLALTVRVSIFTFAYILFPPEPIQINGLIPLVGLSGLGCAIVAYTFRLAKQTETIASPLATSRSA